MVTKFLSEQELRAVSKQFGSSIPQTEPVSVEQLDDLCHQLRELFRNAERSQLSAPHRAAANNALSGFIDTLTGSAVQKVKSISITSWVWNRLLSFYLDRYHDASPSSMKQILSTLMKSISAYQKIQSGKDVEHEPVRRVFSTAQLCLQHIHSNTDLSSVKPSMLLLEALLKKDVMTYEEFENLQPCDDKPNADNELHVCESNNLKDFNVHERSGILQRVVDDVLRWSLHADLSLAAGRLLKIVFVKQKSSGFASSHLQHNSDPVWLSPIMLMAKRDSTDLEKIEKHLLPNLLAIDEHTILRLFHTIPFHQLVHGTKEFISETDIRFALLVVKVMSLMKLSPNIRLAIGSLIRIAFVDLKDRLAISCLGHQSPYVRIPAISLLVSSEGPAASFAAESLNALRYYLPSFFAETEAKTRGEFCNILKKLMQRLLLLINKLRKTNITSNVGSGDSYSFSSDSARSLAHHVEFVSWFKDFLLDELRPSASYQRHVMALRILAMDSTLELFAECQFTIFSFNTIRELIEMVSDAYDDVRSLSADVLRKAGSLHELLYAPQETDNLINVTKLRMSDTGRACISDGYARLLELSFDIGCRQSTRLHGYCNVKDLLVDTEKEISLGLSNIQKAVSGCMLPGQFNALRYILSHPEIYRSFKDYEDWRMFHSTVSKCCVGAWHIAKPILCIDSPEGHGDEEDTVDDSVGIKDTLSFAWRVLKEASTVLQVVLVNANYGYDKRNALEYEDFQDLGNLAFEQLAKLRHRGAFSTVAQFFKVCCIETAKSSEPRTRELIQVWYDRTMQIIQAKASALTRRSAGIPSMLVGILSASPSGQFFDAAIKDLQGMALAVTSDDHEHGKSELPQVHAMNCLKDIFADTHTGPGAEKHLELTLHIAVQSLDHEIWSMRNCGGMLLKAILNRLNSGAGVNVEHIHDGHRRFSKTTYGKYPSLATALESLLRASLETEVDDLALQTTRQVNNGFPALEIIHRVGIHEERKDVVEALLMAQLASPVWLLRERAAETLADVSKPQDLLEKLLRAIESILTSDLVQINNLQGHLLCLKVLIKDCCPGHKYTTFLWLEKNHKRIFDLDCPFTIVAFLETGVIIIDELSKLHLLQWEEESTYWGGSYTILKDACFAWDKRIRKMIKYDGLSKSPTRDTALKRFRIVCSLFAVGLRNTVINMTYTSVDEILAAAKVLLSAEEDWTPLNEILKMVEWITSSALEVGAFSSQVLDALEQLIDVIVGKTPTTDNETFWRSPFGRDEYRLLLALTDVCQKLASYGQRAARIALELLGVLISKLPIGSYQVWLVWASLIFPAISDEADTKRRLAAIRSVGMVKDRLRHMISDWDSDVGQYTSPILAQIIPTIYTALVDDDLAVRNLAAETVGMLLIEPESNSAPPSLTPVEAQSRLFGLAKKYDPNYERLFEYIFGRLAGFAILPQQTPSSRSNATQMTRKEWMVSKSTTLHDSLQRRVGPIAQGIERVLIDDHTLFERERQNLYRDDVQEMEKWSEILTTMRCCPVELDMLYEWVMFGLETISKSIGSPGWAYRRAGFEAVCRALFMARVVQRWTSDITNLNELKIAVDEAREALFPVHRGHMKIFKQLEKDFRQSNSEVDVGGDLHSMEGVSQGARAFSEEFLSD